MRRVHADHVERVIERQPSLQLDGREAHQSGHNADHERRERRDVSGRGRDRDELRHRRGADPGRTPIATREVRMERHAWHPTLGPDTSTFRMVDLLLFAFKGKKNLLIPLG